MFVLTIDQDSSSHGPDRVPELLTVLTDIGSASVTQAGAPSVDTLGDSALAARAQSYEAQSLAPMPGWLLSPERTAGDEVQTVTLDPGTVVAAVRAALRLGGWQIGIGIGEHNQATAQATSTRAASGPAFVAAREAVTAAQSNRINVPLVVRVAPESAAPQAAANFEAACHLIGVIYGRRTARSWDYIDATIPAHGNTHIAQWAVARRESAAQTDIARRFGVSAQAVSQHLRRAAWNEEIAALPLLDGLAGELVIEKTQGET